MFLSAGAEGEQWPGSRGGGGWGVSVGVSVGMPVGLPDPRCGRCMQCRASAPPRGGVVPSRPAPQQLGSERHGTAWPGSCCWPGPRSWRPPPPRR